MDFPNQATPILFYIIAGLTGGSAILAVLAQNIVRAATWLLLALCGAGAIFFLLGADFIGATQILIYAGGTMILVVFGVMLTAQGPFVTMRTSPAEWALSLLAGASLLAVLMISILFFVERPEVSGQKRYAEAQKKILHEALPQVVKKHAPDPTKPLLSNSEDTKHTTTLGLGFLGKGVGPAHNSKAAVGKTEVIRTSYLLPFEIVSVHLLVVLIGAAYLARAKRRGPDQPANVSV